jgi:hypothetical protein
MSISVRTFLLSFLVQFSFSPAWCRCSMVSFTYKNVMFSSFCNTSTLQLLLTFQARSCYSLAASFISQQRNLPLQAGAQTRTVLVEGYRYVRVLFVHKFSDGIFPNLIFLQSNLSHKADCSVKEMIPFMKESLGYASSGIICSFYVLYHHRSYYTSERSLTEMQVFQGYMYQKGHLTARCDEKQRPPFAMRMNCVYGYEQSGTPAACPTINHMCIALYVHVHLIEWKS